MMPLRRGGVDERPPCFFCLYTNYQCLPMEAGVKSCCRVAPCALAICTRLNNARCDGASTGFPSQLTHVTHLLETFFFPYLRFSSRVSRLKSVSLVQEYVTLLAFTLPGKKKVKKDYCIHAKNCRVHFLLRTGPHLTDSFVDLSQKILKLA